jgi:carotenoid cleavage dioxygenase-like enzyme
MAEAVQDRLRIVDPAANPYLSGRFAPVDRETDADDLQVEGTLPTDIDGVFMRNGPNPKFPPLGSYTYPLEGDGMIHAVWIGGGRARYRNRWVWTNGLRAEERAGRALYGGIMTPAFVDQGLLGPDPDPGWPIKLDAFINVVRHADRYLALEEGTPPYEVSPELDTIGRFDFGGGLPLGMCAHPRRRDHYPGRRAGQRVPAHRRPVGRPAPPVPDRGRGVRSARPGPGEHDRLIRWDMSTGQSQAWDTDASIGEVIFVPRDGAAAELDGYYMTLARSVPDDRSWLYIWDAADFPGPPVAKVAIPATVPNGLHANSFTRRR